MTLWISESETVVLLMDLNFYLVCNIVQKTEMWEFDRTNEDMVYFYLCYKFKKFFLQLKSNFHIQISFNLHQSPIWTLPWQSDP